MVTSEQRAQALIQAIVQEAQDIWGEDWTKKLVRAYCEIESEETGQLIKPVQRRSQLVKVFEGGNATIETLMRLVKAINGDLELVFTRKEIRRF